MTKTLVITAIVLVAVVMGLGTLAPALQQVEALRRTPPQAQEVPQVHCGVVGDGGVHPADTGGICLETLCTLRTGETGTVHFLDIDRDREHDHGDFQERLRCIPSLQEP